MATDKPVATLSVDIVPLAAPTKVSIQIPGHSSSRSDPPEQIDIRELDQAAVSALLRDMVDRVWKHWREDASNSMQVAASCETCGRGDWP